MESEHHNQAVSVDPGDLSEVCQSANAWASQLRNRADDCRRQGDHATAIEDAQRYTKAADRIDQAVRRLRVQSHVELLADETPPDWWNLMSLVDDAFDNDVLDMLNERTLDTWETREYAAAIATIVIAHIDGKDPTGLNAFLNEKFEYQGGHVQPHEKPVSA